MKKKIKMAKLVVTVLAGLVANGHADLTSFRWYNTEASNLVNHAGVAIAANDATVLTYLSADNTINFDPNTLFSPTYGNDFFYQALGNALNGRLITSYMTETVTDYRGYYTYAIVLEMPLAVFTGTYAGNVANVPSGVYAAITPMFGPLDNMDVGSPLPQSFNATVSVIPEPATFMFFGFGGFGVWLMRRNKGLTDKSLRAGF